MHRSENLASNPPSPDLAPLENEARYESSVSTIEDTHRSNKSSDTAQIGDCRRWKNSRRREISGNPIGGDGIGEREEYLGGAVGKVEEWSWSYDRAKASLEQLFAGSVFSLPFCAGKCHGMPMQAMGHVCMRYSL